MTFTKTALAALLFGASLTPAFAESGETVQTPVAAYEQALAHPVAPMIEGRQAAPIATSSASNEQYLGNRVTDQDR